MPAGKQDIVRAYRNAQQQAEELVASATESAWSRGAYEQGWNAKQLLCHLADSCNVARFLIAITKNPRPPSTEGVAFDIDRWNAQQVALREGKSVSELLSELTMSIGREIEAIEAAPNELLSAHTSAPWAEGPLADLIMGTITDHYGMHLADLRAATA